MHAAVRPTTSPAAPLREPLLVLYDGGCGFCVWALSLFLRLDRQARLAVAPIQSVRDGVLAAVPDDRVLQSWHVRLPDGEVRSAGAALVTVLRALALTSGVGLLLGRRPALAEHLYALVATRRAGLARVLPRGAKDGARDLVERRRASSTHAGAPAPEFGSAPTA